MSTKPKCPICTKQAGPNYTPFCSKRCSDIDLGRWLKGSYILPGIDGDAMLPANDRDDESNL